MTSSERPVFDDDFRAGFDTLMAWRRDVPRFDSRPIEPKIIDDLLDRACLAPSVGNAQPWYFVAYLCMGYPAYESDEPELIKLGWQDKIDRAKTRFVR